MGGNATPAVSLAVATLLGAASVACSDVRIAPVAGGDTADTATATTSTSTTCVGAADCACEPDKTCNEGLVCVDGVCRPPECPCIGHEKIGGICRWAGGPADPGLSGTGAWTVRGSVVLDPTAPGSSSPGVARFSLDELDTYGSALSQRFDMPEHGCMEPLALTFDARTEIWGTATNPTRALGMVLGGGWTNLDWSISESWTDWMPGFKCLGARAFSAGPIDLAFTSPAPVLDSWVDLANIELDEIRIVSKPDCPAPETTVNGDFEAGSTGWTTTSLVDESPPSAVVAGAGSMGSTGALLTTDFVTDDLWLVGTTSPPMDSTLPTPALRMWAEGSTITETEVGFDLRPLASLPRQPAPDVRVCIPPWAQGLTAPMYIALRTRGGGSDEAFVQSIALDDLVFVSETACQTSGGLVDPGFENALTAPSVVSWTKGGWINGQDAATVEMHVDGPGDAQAHGGKVCARLVNTNGCSGASLETTITVPPPSGAQGPAVHFWYRLASVGSVAAVFTSDHADELPGADGWTATTHCLAPGAAGRPEVLSFAIGYFAGGGVLDCSLILPGDELWVDDVTVTTDPTCPPS